MRPQGNTAGDLPNPAAHESKPKPLGDGPPPAHAAAAKHPGDIPVSELRAAMHQVADMVADYFENLEHYPVVPKIRPGDVRAALPPAPPNEPEPLARILADYRSLIEPNTTHWNHPGFMSYFAVTGSGPGVLGEALAAALNNNAMLWRTGPASTELEERVCDWLRQMMGLPAEFKGHINDTASTSSMLALTAARQRVRDFDVRRRGLAGRSELPRLRIYASEQAHSSIAKAAIVIGVGLENLRKIPTDKEFRMQPAALAAAIREDRAAGMCPMAVVATVGTTSTTSIDPVPEIAAICRREGLWLHIDSAYAGVAAMCPELRALMPGLGEADSLVTNAHKWLFVPSDCSVLFVRDAAQWRETFSIVPHYLSTSETDATNLMDYGVQLGRRFRSLKMWMVLRAFGVSGLQERIRKHCRLARMFADWVRAEPGFELIAPVLFSTICFRAVPDLPPAQQDEFNARLLQTVNAAGPVLVSHTQLNDRYVMRIAIGSLRTEERHLAAAWKLIRDTHREMLSSGYGRR
jgi:aromatic-L-amino-acid decarboxylase